MVHGLLLAALVLAQAATPSPSPTPLQSLDDAWWTGPMLASGAGTLPRGHVLVEPYLFDVAKPQSHSYGSLTYMLYGLADRFTVGLIPVFGYNTATGAASSSNVGVGDLSLLAQYRLTQYHVGKHTPTTSVVVQESLPTGKYDRLGANPNNGFGGGAYTTTVSYYIQAPFWLRNGRILRMRLDTSQAFSTTAAVDDVSVFGTSAGFHGSAKPGSAFFTDLSAEYSITRSWVAALDLFYRHDNNTHVSGGTTIFDSGPSNTFAYAPGIEYSWTPNVGILLAARIIPPGLGHSKSITPAIAINIVR